MRAVAISATQALTWFAIASAFAAPPGMAAGPAVAVLPAVAAEPTVAVLPAVAAEPATAAEPAAAATPAIGPHEVMADLSASLFAALDKDSAAARHNADKVLPLIDRLLSPHFDTEYAGRLVLGLHWRSATPDQRQHLAIALYRRLLRTYAGAVAEWTADRVKLLPLRADTAALQVTVHTLVTNSQGVLVPVDYRLHQTAEEWKIFDVVVDGVSYVRIYHDDTDAEVTQVGLDGAIARLEKLDAGAASGTPRSEPHRPQR
jgi:phospholipid transport system substrate-binding protein